MPLLEQRQADFASGMWRSVEPHLIPDHGCWDLLNYLLDSDGSIYRRGGVLEYSGASIGTDLSFIWDGHLGPGQRTVVASGAGFAVLDEDQQPVNLGGAGLTQPTRAHVIGGRLIFDGGVTYGGSLMAADYTTGTVSVTNGSKVVTGSGTTWNTLVDEGMIFRINGGTREYVVESVDSVTQITLSEAYEGSSNSGLAYWLTRLGLVSRIAPAYAVVGKRLFAFDHDKAWFTAYGDAEDSPANDYHQIPGGAEILGGDALGDNAVVFTTEGTWTISNISLDEINDFGDVQHRLDHVNPVVLWDKEGIARWDDSLIVPGLDGVWLMGSELARLDLSISRLYADYVRSGYKLGVAWVDRAHYFLPVLGSGNSQVDLLVCRLDRPTRSRLGTIFPWSHFDGDGAAVRAGTVRIVQGEGPKMLLAAENPSVLEARYFEPDANVADDLGVNFTEQVITRDFQTGQGNQNVSRWAQLEYEMWDTQEDDDPTVTGAYSIGERLEGVSDWGQFAWGQADWSDPDTVAYVDIGTAPEELEGLAPAKWAIAGPNGAPRSRYIRFRLRSSGRVAKLMIRGLKLWTRQSTKAD